MTSSMDVMRWVACVPCYVVTCIAVLSVLSVFSPNVRTITVTEYVLLCISISILNAQANLGIHVCGL